VLGTQKGGEMSLKEIFFGKRRRMLHEIPVEPDIAKLIDAYGNARFMTAYAIQIGSRIGEQGWTLKAIEAKKDLLEAIEAKNKHTPT
jgi:hypothetical protein